MDKPEIKLVDHVGKTQSGREVDHGQWIVFADDQQVGYLPKSPGAWLQCIVTMDEETREVLVQAVNEAAMTEIGGVAEVPSFEDDEDN